MLKESSQEGEEGGRDRQADRDREGGRQREFLIRGQGKSPMSLIIEEWSQESDKGQGRRTVLPSGSQSDKGQGRRAVLPSGSCWSKGLLRGILVVRDGCKQKGVVPVLAGRERRNDWRVPNTDATEVIWFVSPPFVLKSPAKEWGPRLKITERRIKAGQGKVPLGLSEGLSGYQIHHHHHHHYCYSFWDRVSLQVALTGLEFAS